MNKEVVLPISYLGSIDYFAAMAQSDLALIEQFETFPKQTLRNRCRIYGANGAMDLTIPTTKGPDKSINAIRFDNDSPWRNRHWQAILSSYKSTPFFDFIEPELQPFYESSGDNLMTELWGLTRTITKIIGIESPVVKTSYYENDYSNKLDLRASFKPSKSPQLFVQPTYYQIFSDKHGYLPNLSILDLICHEGRNSLEYLKQVEVKI